MSSYLISQGYSNDPNDKKAFNDYNDMMKLGAVLVGSIAGAIAGGGTAQNALAGAKIGETANDNNRRLHPNEKEIIKLKAGGNKAEEERLIQAACYAVQCWAQYPEGSPLYNVNYVSEQDAQALKSEITWVQGMQSNGQFAYSGFDQLTDNIAAFTGVSRGTIGGKPIDSLTKPITDSGFCATAECAAGFMPDRPLSQADIDEKRNGAADFASSISEQASRFSAIATANGAYLALQPNPLAQGGGAVEFGLAGTATIVGLGASAVEQLLRPQPWSLGFNGFIDLTNFYVSEKFPILSPVINEVGEVIKTSPLADQMKNPPTK